MQVLSERYFSVLDILTIKIASLLRSWEEQAGTRLKWISLIKKVINDCNFRDLGIMAYLLLGVREGRVWSPRKT